MTDDDVTHDVTDDVTDDDVTHDARGLDVK